MTKDANTAEETLPSTAVAPQSEDIAAVQTKVDSMKATLESVTVTNQEELEAVTIQVGNIAKMRKYIKQEMGKFLEPAKAIIEATKEKYDPYLQACDTAEAALKEKARVFMLAEKQREDAAKAKEVKKVETGYQKPETAIKKMEQIPEAKKTVKAGGATLKMKTVKKVRIVDATLIPDEYYKPRELDQVKINKVALAGVSIPGVEVYDDQQMSR